MNYRTIDDMFEPGTLVRLTDLWTPALARYRDRPAVVIDIEVLGYPRSISQKENGTSVSEKYDCIYTVALMPAGGAATFAREQVPVIRVISLDVAGMLPGEQDSAATFAAWCAREFCGAEPAAISSPHTTGTGRFIGAAVLPHTIPMYEARHRPSDHRNKSLEAIDQVRAFYRAQPQTRSIVFIRGFSFFGQGQGNY